MNRYLGMNQFQAMLEILLLSLIVFMGIAIIHILISNPRERETIQLPVQLVMMPDDVRERGDYLLTLIKDGHFKYENHNQIGS
jgi:hypothetical protein